VFLAWASQDTVWAVGTDGAVHRSADAGTTWTRTGTAGGPPEAFTADADGTVAVAISDAIVLSTDGGRTFAPVAHKSAGGH